MPGLWRVDCCLYFQHKELDRKNAQILCLPGHHLLELAGDGRRKHWLSPVVCKCVAIAATQFSMCKISTVPLCTYSLRRWFTALYLPESARRSLWCSPVIALRTALASVYNRSAPCSWTVVFHTIKLHRWPLSCQGCQYLSLFFLGVGGH